MSSEQSKRIAVYAGSFDPMTVGHLSVARRGARLFDEVILAIGENPAKRYLLPFQQRIALVQAAVADIPNISVARFEGLLVDYCQRVGAVAILRGLRTAGDFNFEYQIGIANMDMAPQIETVFLLGAPENLFISSSLVKEIAGGGGDVSRYLPGPVLGPVMAALGKQ
jgi:pantetheine-phosphate adenylyltransferase